MNAAVLRESPVVQTQPESVDDGCHISLKTIGAILLFTTVAVGTQIGLMKASHDGGSDNSEPVQGYYPNRQAMVIAELPNGGHYEAPSMKLHQIAPDGEKITFQLPVSVGELAVHGPGDKVAPVNLDPPQR